VLRKKGCHGASTIHSLIYRPKDKSREHLRALEKQYAELQEKGGPAAEIAKLEIEMERERQNLARPAFSLNEESELREASLVIVDECSMVDEQMAQDLLYFGVPLLVLGDPAQLPPVAGFGYFTDARPDFMLTDVKRQALDNPILQLATTVREGDRIATGTYGESVVLPYGSKLTPELALGFEQIIVGKNATRRAINNRCRSLLGRTQELPQAGDKLVCLRNNHDLGVLNGTLWNTQVAVPVYDGKGDVEHVTLEITSMDEPQRPAIDLNAHPHPFRGEDVPLFLKREAQEFDYGYALTCHKSQGSQWDNVLVLDESHVFRKEAARWLYTAITRAAERITIIQ
jgi:exodeoxyribonuclease-5